MKTAQVHRFRDHVAIYVGNGETVYMSEANARKLARAIYTCARSVRNETFVNSTCGTTEIQLKDRS